jgi:hypothetical protein
MAKHNQNNKTELKVNPSDLTHCLLSCLNQRDQDVLKRRFALNRGNKETLEEVGQSYQITRERVRQIEAASLNKIKKIVAYKELLGQLTGQIDKTLERFGGIIAHHHLTEELLRDFKIKSPKLNIPKERNHLVFLLEKFACDLFYFHKPKKYHKSAWSKRKNYFRSLKQNLRHIEQFLTQYSKPASHHKIAKVLNKPVDSIYSYLQLSKNIIQDPFGLWGMDHWPEVSPRRMADRVYVILKKYGEPLHYKDITLYIEKHYNRKTHAPTVHNELIADKRFVLVGRGIYALAQWGYVSGTVAQVVEKILLESKKPLTREEIIDQVRSQRLVSRSTILLALNNNQRIKKVGKDKYQISN